MEHSEEVAASAETTARATGSAPGALATGVCHAIFFLSGAAALVCQLSWSRQIGLLFGHTVHAAAVVLGSYFAGMALGYLLGARWAPRVPPLAGYAAAELIVAGWACFIPVLLSWSETPVIAAWLSSPSPTWQTGARALFCLSLLLPATTALGVTLPMIAEFLSGREGRALADAGHASRVSIAYACNTAGAMAGVFLATFHLLVVVGVRASSYLAALSSVVCAVGALLLVLADRRKQAGSGEEGGRQGDGSQTRGGSVTNPGWVALAGLSGFGTLALEVLYTRMFSLVFHNSTYTFGLVVLVFLAALALGAAVASRLQRRFPSASLAGWAAGLGSLGIMSSVLVFVALTKLEYYSFGQNFTQYLLGACLLVAVVVAPPITLLGMLLPLAWKAAGRDGGAGRVVGRLTAVNTLAAAAGALAASFLLLPTVGLWPSFVLVAVVFFLAPFFLLVDNGRLLLASGVAVTVAALAVLTVRSPVEGRHGQTKLGEKLVRRWHSPYGWIDVVRVEKTGSLRVRQNLHYRFGETGENAREYRQAHIPLLLHPQPKDVLFLGLGTGLTAGGAVPHGEVERIVAVELIPEVVEAARLLAGDNYGVADHPRVEIRVDDARHYLLATDRRFDVIVSDLFVPWESESGYLYTVEHYRVARQRLKPGGLFCQWLPLYQLGVREFEMIADSFASEFPVATVWWGEVKPARPIVALIGSDEPIVIDAEPLEARLAALRQAASSTDESLKSPESVYGAYQGDWSVRHPDRLNTDEHPRVEFQTPVSHRNRDLLQGPVLRKYHDDVLAKLPTTSARLRSGGQLAPPSILEKSRAWRRLFLSGGK